MSNVFNFGPPLLTPFLGKWMLDKLSVSRKVATHIFGKDDFKKLYACNSIEELRQCAASDPLLAEKYERRLALSEGSSYLLIGPKGITWVRADREPTTYPVLGVTNEGRKTVVRSVYRGRPIGFVLRMKNAWLLTSQEEYGRNALLPRSPTFRWYRAPA